MSQYDRGMMPYYCCTAKELKQLCIQRNLPTTTSGRATKAQLTDILENADDQATFQHFMDPPPELRVRTYTIYFNNLPPLEQPAQPPISKVSRLVRQESLPLFYSSCTFMLNVDKAEADADENFDITFYGTTFNEIKGEFFRNISEEHLRMIEKLGIEASFVGSLLDTKMAWLGFGRQPRTNYEHLSCPRLAQMLDEHLDEMRARGLRFELTRADIGKFIELFLITQYTE